MVHMQRLNSGVMSPNLRSSGNVFWSNELLKIVVSNGTKMSSFSFSIRGGILSIIVKMK